MGLIGAGVLESLGVGSTLHLLLVFKVLSVQPQYESDGPNVHRDERDEPDHKPYEPEVPIEKEKVPDELKQETESERSKNKSEMDDFSAPRMEELRVSTEQDALGVESVDQQNCCGDQGKD